MNQTVNEKYGVTTGSRDETIQSLQLAIEKAQAAGDTYATHRFQTTFAWFVANR